METFKVSKHFTCAEFLPPAQHKIVMARKTEAERLAKFYMFMDKRTVEYAEKVRVYFGVPVTINNWNSGGSYTLRGWRPRNTSVGAKNSMHKFGKAVDMDIKGLTAEEVRQMIKDDQKLFYSYGLRRVEENVSWLHSDIKDVDGYENKIYFFNP